MEQAALIKHYEDKLAKVRRDHPGWRGEEYVAYAEAELEAAKNGGMEGLRKFWAANAG